MPAPIVPLLLTGLRYGSIALTGALIARKYAQNSTTKHAQKEAAFNDVSEGFSMENYQDEHEAQTRIEHGFSRIIRWGGRAVIIDSHILGRFRIRPLKQDR